MKVGTTTRSVYHTELVWARREMISEKYAQYLKHLEPDYIDCFDPQHHRQHLPLVSISLQV